MSPLPPQQTVARPKYRFIWEVQIYLHQPNIASSAGDAGSNRSLRAKYLFICGGQPNLLGLNFASSAGGGSNKIVDQNIATSVGLKNLPGLTFWAKYHLICGGSNKSSRAKFSGKTSFHLCRIKQIFQANFYLTCGDQTNIPG